MFQLKPSEIMFSQESINNYFDKRSGHKGVLIGETLDDICEGRCSVYDIPTINVMMRDGKWVTADNRRLWVLRQLERLGKCDGILVRETFYIDPAKLNSRNGGVSVRVRRYAGGRWHNKPSVTRSAPKVNVAINYSPKYETHRKPVVKPSVTNTLNSIISTSTANTGHSTYTYSRPSSGTALNKTISSVKNEIQPTANRIIEPSVVRSAPKANTVINYVSRYQTQKIPSPDLQPSISNYSNSLHSEPTTRSAWNDTVYPNSRAFDRRDDRFLAQTVGRDFVIMDIEDYEKPGCSCPCVIL